MQNASIALFTVQVRTDGLPPLLEAHPNFCFLRMELLGQMQPVRPLRILRQCRVNLIETLI